MNKVWRQFGWFIIAFMIMFMYYGITNDSLSGSEKHIQDSDKSPFNLIDTMGIFFIFAISWTIFKIYYFINDKKEREVKNNEKERNT